MEMFLGGWVLMVGVGMVPGTVPAARLVSSARGALDRPFAFELHGTCGFTRDFEYRG